MKIQKMMSLVTAIMFILCATLAGAEDQRAWLKRAQVGPLTPKTQDWKAIKKAARKEGKVVIYSVSSRIFKLQKKFKKKFGVRIEAYDIASGVALEKFRREHRAGVYNVDVLFNNDTPLILNEFLPQKRVWNFVPDSVAPFLDKNEMEPFLTQRWSSRVVFYNSFRNPDASPVDNLWDLTRKEWKGKLLIPNPLEGSTMANVMQTILQHSDEMAEAYKQEFGKPVDFSKKLVKLTKKNPSLAPPDAAKEWLYRVLRNAVFLKSTTKIFKNIAGVKQNKPPIGISTFSKIRKNKKKVFEAQPSYKMNPVFGVAYPTVLLIADRAPHPNAAKLLIRYMMEDGFKAWNVIGDYAARSDMAKKQVDKFGIPPFTDLKMWKIDPNYVYDTKFAFVALFVGLK
ncbi:MAG: ABC transporter substrate-binding protein [Candidatus Binatia bacterium]